MLWPCRSSQGHSTAVSRWPCCVVALKRKTLSEHGMASVNQTRPRCVNQMGKTHSKLLAAGMAGEGHRNGMDTECYVWIGHNSTLLFYPVSFLLSDFLESTSLIHKKYIYLYRVYYIAFITEPQTATSHFKKYHLFSSYIFSFCSSRKILEKYLFVLQIPFFSTSMLCSYLSFHSQVFILLVHHAPLSSLFFSFFVSLLCFRVFLSSLLSFYMVFVMQRCVSPSQALNCYKLVRSLVIWKRSIIYFSLNLSFSVCSSYFPDFIILLSTFFLPYFLCLGGTWWRSWLRHCATSRKGAGSIPDGVQPHYGPGIDSASNRNAGTLWASPGL